MCLGWKSPIRSQFSPHESGHKLFVGHWFFFVQNDVVSNFIGPTLNKKWQLGPLDNPDYTPFKKKKSLTDVNVSLTGNHDRFWLNCMVVCRWPFWPFFAKKCPFFLTQVVCNSLTKKRGWKKKQNKKTYINVVYKQQRKQKWIIYDNQVLTKLRNLIFTNIFLDLGLFRRERKRTKMIKCKKFVILTWTCFIDFNMFCPLHSWLYQHFNQTLYEYNIQY